MRSPTASSAPGEAPKPVTRFPTVRAGPPPLAEGEPEELSSALLADDSSEVPLTGRVPPQPISSSSLVEDPDSDPEIEQDDEPAEAPIFAPVALAVVGSHRSPPAPGVAKPPAPRTADFTPRLASVEAPIFAPTGVVPGAMTDPFSSRDREPQFESLVASDPFARPTQPPRARDLSPDDSGRTYVAPPPQPPPWWTRPPVIIGGAVATVLVAAVLAFALRSTTPTSEQPSKSAQLASAAPSPTESSPPGQTRSTADPTLAATASRPPSSVGGSPCVLAGAPHVVAPRALMKAGIETASNADLLALGVAVGEHEGLVVALDPSTFVVTATSHPKTSDALHRVVPLLPSGSDLGSFLESSHRHATIESAYPVASDPPFVVGVARGNLVWAASRTSNPEPLWPIDPNLPVEALRAIVLPNHAGYALAFRQGASLLLGALADDKKPNGELVRISGLGPQVGAPTLAAGNDHVVVAWADRTAPTVPWGLRWVKWHPGTEPGEPAPFPVPGAGDGAAEMSPAITSLAGGRFVMAWTEAMGAQHVVRAEALDGTEHPIGTTLTVSADGVNAGQGMPVFTADGRGTVVFLATPTGATASVVAVPVICPAGG